MEDSTFRAVLGTIIIIVLSGVMATCSYKSQTNYNECVKSAQTVEIAQLCKIK